jgi:hypothetical protein
MYYLLHLALKTGVVDYVTHLVSSMNLHFLSSCSMRYRISGTNFSLGIFMTKSISECGKHSSVAYDPYTSTLAPGYVALTTLEISSINF